MLNKKQYQAYAAAMQTMAGTRQVVMLYDGIIRNLQQSRDAMRERRVEDRFNYLTRSSEIVFGLQGCLDFEKGGEVAQILYNFYSSLDMRIFALHRTGDEAACEQLIAEIKQMRDVWNEIDQAQGETSGGSAAAPEAVPSLEGVTMPAADNAGSSTIAISA